jgi:hypothetical protein
VIRFDSVPLPPPPPSLLSTRNGNPTITTISSIPLVTPSTMTYPLRQRDTRAPYSPANGPYYSSPGMANLNTPVNGNRSNCTFQPLASKSCCRQLPHLTWHFTISNSSPHHYVRLIHPMILADMLLPLCDRFLSPLQLRMPAEDKDPTARLHDRLAPFLPEDRVDHHYRHTTENHNLLSLPLPRPVLLSTTGPLPILQDPCRISFLLPDSRLWIRLCPLLSRKPCSQPTHPVSAPV